MLTALSVIIAMAFPFLVVAASLWLSAWIQRARAEAVALQVAVSDAIDREFGSIVAPRVKRWLWGPWEIIIAVPFERYDMIGKMFTLAYRASSLSNPDRFRFVLTPRDASSSCAGSHSR
jgi:hypothetical protein